MPTEQIVARLEQRYPRLERVAEAVFRAVDLYNDSPYAVRYFDLSDDLVSAAGQLHEYQERLLGASYFNVDSKADLRWNHYLYFVTATQRADKAFRHAKATVECNQEYARKIVLTETELAELLEERPFPDESREGFPLDALSVWMNILEEHRLGFIVDQTLQVPSVIRHIAHGQQRPVLRPPATPKLESAEAAVATDRLAGIAIRAFRQYPVRKTFDFGVVNLILGVNGVGKTSLLEAIEYLFCGKTRRVGSVLPRTVVSGTLAPSNLTLHTRTTTSRDRLRSRHLVWYGKSELRTLTLHDSFSKFNFLDTDAAVRLTVDKSRERIIDDLARLLLGAEASKVLDRFERVGRQLAETKKTIKNDILLRETRHSEAVARLQSLREAPQESDSVFSDVLVGLRNPQWLELPSDKHKTDQLSASLQAALANVTILREAGHGIAPDVTELDTTLRRLGTVGHAIDGLAKEAAARQSHHLHAKRALQAVSRRLDAINALAPIVGAGVHKLHRERQMLERRLGERRADLAEAEAAVGRLPSDKALRRGPLSVVMSNATETARRADERLGATQRELASFERNQTRLSSLRQALRSSAHEIMRHTADERRCPLCQAEYSEAELHRRLKLLSSEPVTSESDRLRNELQTADGLRQQRLSELTALRSLERYIRADPGTATLDEAISSVSRASEEVATWTSELSAVQEALREHEEEGWTFERLVELASTAGIADTEFSLDGIEGTRAPLREEQKRAHEAITRLEGDAQRALERAAEIGVAYDLSHPTIAELSRVVSERSSAVEERRRATVALQEQLDLTGIGSASEAEARLREVQSLLARLRTLVAQEQRDAETIERESKLLSDAVAEVDGLRVRLGRIDSAETVLKDLLGQQSERVLAETVLRENADSITSTFAKIHSPNEFDLKVDGGLTIVRRGGENVDLDEMSSGQRAAYALSLFFAMNERLRSGPKVLLLDDPVAHVDDINTLSLLDHLRDLALSGERQIFFATADSKIGALFGRKFRFLGDGFVQIELARE